MKKILGICIILWCAVPVRGTTFIHSPEDYFQPGWLSSNPYPRNVFWDFAVDPESNPTDAGAPGAQYNGWDDDILKVGDFVQLNGNMQWYESVEGSDLSGLVGIDNRNGTTMITGSLTIHLDNSKRSNLNKHIWMESMSCYYKGQHMYFLTADAPSGYSVTLGIPTPSSQIYIGTDDFTWIQRWNLALVEPNPPWEQINWSFHVYAGEAVFFDYIHIATECVPEPTSLILLGVGAVFMRRIKYIKNKK